MSGVWDNLQSWWSGGPQQAGKPALAKTVAQPAQPDPEFVARLEARNRDAVKAESVKWGGKELALQNDISIARQQATYLKAKYESQAEAAYAAYEDVVDFKTTALDVEKAHGRAIVDAHNIIKDEVGDYYAHSSSAAGMVLQLVALQDSVRAGKPFKKELEAVTDVETSQTFLVPYAAVHADVLEASASGLPTEAQLRARIADLARQTTIDDSADNVAERGLRAAVQEVTGTTVSFDDQNRAAQCARRGDWVCVSEALSGWSRQFPDNRYDTLEYTKIKAETRELAKAAAVQKRTQDLLSMAAARVRLLEETVADAKAVGGAFGGR